MNDTITCRILLADDHAIFRSGLVSILEDERGFSIVGQAENGEEAVNQYRRLRPDIMLLDLRMPQLDGLDAVIQIRRFDPDAKIIILTTYDLDEDIDRALRAGAKAFLLKDADPDELVRCIRDVSIGKTRVSPAIATKLAERFTQVQLTAREYDVLRLMGKGISNKEIAKELGVREGTVKVHVMHLFEKLSVSTRTEAVAVAVRRGIIRID